MTDHIASFLREVKLGVRALLRVKGFTATVVLTLALGIGANAAMFSLLRDVLLRPLVNRDEDHLIYIRQSKTNDRDVTFSMPEIADLSSRVKTMSAFGDFSEIGFTLLGLGEPRTVRAGVVGGSYFQVMGLRPVLGRLLDAHDDGPNAPGVAVLTYRFWSTDLKRDPAVIGRTIRLNSFIDARPATIVGVLEPSIPYPQDTEVISNVVTSAHHLSATMVTSRLHRMTELFGRLAPGVTLEQARAELRTVYGAMKKEHPGPDYPAKDDYEIHADRLRDELTHGARTILLVLTIGSVLVFVIACANVANLLLARTIRRDRELSIRVAMGASAGALRRILLTESLLLCTGGAVLGLLIADPLLSVLSRYISRYSIRALDLTVDASMLWVGVGLAIAAAVLLAFVPRLPSSGPSMGPGLASASVRFTGAANRKLRIFALVQVAASFVLVAAAGATVNTLLSLEAARAGLDTHNVLSVDVPVMHTGGRTPQQIVDFYKEITRQIRELPGVQNVSIGSTVPWRDGANFDFQFAPDGRAAGPDDEKSRARVRVIAPGFFATVGLPMLEGRDFTDADRGGSQSVAVVSESLARKEFPSGDALGHSVQWTDPILKAVPMLSTQPLRIVGVVADLDDVNVLPKPAMTIYRPYDQETVLGGGELFVHVGSNPAALVTPITQLVRKLSAEQPVENAQTLAEVRTKVLSDDRLNVVVSSVFGGVALLIAVVGIAGVLAFSVSGRTREFGIRLAVGSQPRNLLLRVMGEGAAIAAGGLAAGFACGYWLAQLATSFLGEVKMPGVLPVAGSALVLLLAAVIASVVPAARAARVDVIQALRTE
ncbi:MAG TPA: ADOP family duplicated permease [Bryobacteraceae bacterium]|nr:ADOP family duplicated permease [Bryobacteraceae bacterium]